MPLYPVQSTSRFVRGTKGGKTRLGLTVWYEQAPALGTNTAILAATTLAELTATLITTGITQPDVPRVVLVKGNAAGIAGTVLIEGSDSNGTLISETLTLNGTAAVGGTLAFAHVRRITLPIRTASGNTVSVGTGNVLGLWHALAADVRLVTAFNDADDLGTLAIDATDVSKNLFTPAGTLNGAKVLRILYVI